MPDETEVTLTSNTAATTSDGTVQDIHVEIGEDGNADGAGLVATSGGTNYLDSWSGTAGSSVIRRPGWAFAIPTDFYPADSNGFLQEPAVIKHVEIRFKIGVTVADSSVVPKVYFWLVNRRSQPSDDNGWSDFSVINRMPGPNPTSLSALYWSGEQIPLRCRSTDTNIFFNEAFGPWRDFALLTADEYDFTLASTIELDAEPFNRVASDPNPTLGGEDGPTGDWLIGCSLDRDQEFADLSGTKATPDIQVSFADGIGQSTRLDVTYVPFHTGYHTTRQDRTRAVRDQRLGAPAYSADLVEDGFKRGTWVNSWDRDPDDIYEERIPRSRGERMTDGKPVR